MKISKATLLLASLLLMVATCAAQSDPASRRAAASAKAKPVPPPTGASQRVDDMLDSFQMMEQGFWKAWKNRDVKPFAQHLSPDAIMIDDNGIAERADILKSIGGCDVKNYSLSDFKLTKVDSDAALLTYKVTSVDATCGGKKVPENILAASLFKKVGGTWTELFHQETAASASDKK
ncbi:MAG: hypothetical protein JWO13_313 [Acidobacteriales bacterium]|nr:hypothetical protein [Terriglobales bacterium]